MIRAAATLLLLLCVTAEAAAPPAAEKCSLTKMKAATKKVAAKMSCYEKAGMHGTTVDAACLAKAEAAFTNAFSKAEEKGDCATTGDAGTVETGVDAFVADLVSELAPPTSTTSTSTSSSSTTTTACVQDVGQQCGVFGTCDCPKVINCSGACVPDDTCTCCGSLRC